MGTLSTQVNNNHQLRQDFTKVWGTHAIKTGYEWLWQNQVSHDIGNPRLSLGFGATNGLQGNGQSIPNTGGITLADVMLGYVTSYSYAQQGASLLPEDSIHSFYVQDDWRIHHRGQRVDVQGHPDQGAGQSANPARLLQPVQVVQLESAQHHDGPKQPGHFCHTRSE
jgi:hypothetical protein